MEVMAYSIQTHIFMIVFLIGLIAINIYRLFNQNEFIRLVKTYRLLTPLFHLINACVAYTGMIVSAYTHDVSPTVILMIAATIFVMVTEIKRYKKMRVIKLDQTEKQEEFRAFAKKIAFMQLLALMLTFVISKLF